jgi:beta-galactosidase
MCAPFDPVGHLSDVVSWNLYLGWYTPFMWLNNLWVDYFHKRYPNRCLGYSEYGCECMPNLHSSRPVRGDQSEEYQCKYNEYMLKFFEKRPFMWATHLWNMFDFAADARNQGGEPGMNHKGLVTFDRKTKKDSFFLYKAWWSKDPFVYLCGRRYVDRAEKTTLIKVYSNLPEVTLYVNGQKFETQKGDKIFNFRVPMYSKMKVVAKAGKYSDEIKLRKVEKPNPDYHLSKKKAGGGNWT